MYHDGHELQTLIDAGKPDMWTRQDIEDIDERTLGVLVARWAEWDVRRVVLTCMAALEDANCHTECAALEESARHMGVFE